MIVAANFKMNLNLKDYKHFLKNFNTNASKDTEIILCPPFVYLNEFKKLKKDFYLGAQDVSEVAVGRHTGQVSASMLKDFGVEFVIVGHSERRGFELDEQIANKVKQAVDNGIIPIVCVGENVKNQDDAQIINQVNTALSKIENSSNIIIAYEPVWAIGSGEIPSAAYINKKTNLIKKLAKKLGFKIKVLYGGSVDAKYLSQLKKCSLDGYLVGGLSLDVNKFLNFVRLV